MLSEYKEQIRQLRLEVAELRAENEQLRSQVQNLNRIIEQMQRGTSFEVGGDMTVGGDVVGKDKVSRNG